jgi:hypothetical protein
MADTPTTPNIKRKTNYDLVKKAIMSLSEEVLLNASLVSTFLRL